MLRVVGVWWVEGDAEPDLDVPAGDMDFFDEYAEQLLSLRMVKLVDDAADLVGEIGDAAAQQVSVGKRSPLGGEAVAFGPQPVEAGGDVTGAVLQLWEIDQSGLIKVDQSAPFGDGDVDLAVEADEFSGEQLVVGDRAADRDGLFSSEQHLGPGQRGADVVEDELVESVGADVAFRAAAVLPAGA